MKKYLLLPLIGLALFGAGCLDMPTAATSLTPDERIKSEQELVNDTLNKLQTAVQPPVLANSLERANIKKRLETFDNPNKVSYVYLVSFGRVMSFYTIKGKVTSSHKRFIRSTQFVRCDGGQYTVDCDTEAPSLDGTYGDSDDYVYFWTTDGTYVQWSGDYMLVDQPLKLSTQPELIREIK